MILPLANYIGAIDHHLLPHPSMPLIGPYPVESVVPTSYRAIYNKRVRVRLGADYLLLGAKGPASGSGGRGPSFPPPQLDPVLSTSSRSIRPHGWLKLEPRFLYGLGTAITGNGPDVSFVTDDASSK